MDNMALLVADLYEVAGALRAAGEQLAATQGQTQARWQVMSVISDPPTTVPSAARRLGVTRQNVQKIANALARDGLAEWHANPDHRSSPLLSLTPQGVAILAAITELARKFNDDISGGITAREINATRDVAQRISRRIEALDA